MVGWSIVRLKDENIVLPVADILGAEGGSVCEHIIMHLYMIIFYHICSITDKINGT